MLRYIFFAILFYLVYLGLKTLLSRFGKFNKKFASHKKGYQGASSIKKDINNIEDADFEEIKKS